MFVKENPDRKKKTKKQKKNIFFFSYDYDSLTHYGPRTFSKDFISETIEALHPDRQDASLMGQRSGFSILDAKQINKIFVRLYSCFRFAELNAGKSLY